jgi:hypothetical protein
VHHLTPAEPIFSFFKKSKPDTCNKKKGNAAA